MLTELIGTSSKGARVLPLLFLASSPVFAADVAPLEERIREVKIVKQNGRTSFLTDFHTFYRISYSDPGDTSNPSDLKPLPQKSRDEITQGINLRRHLEGEWGAYFAASNISFTKRWTDPLGGRGEFSPSSFVPQKHEAIDIFVAKEGVPVYSPVNGVVIASGSGWKGKCCKGKLIHSWNGYGLTPKAGNAVVIYEPSKKGYLWISHLGKVNATAGDIVLQGQEIGAVGNTGNASRYGGGNHIHMAYKLPAAEGTLKGMNVSSLLKEAQKHPIHGVYANR